MNRKIYTALDDKKSSLKDIKFGVPQGSVLGPILFSLYINDIKVVANNHDMSLFADDTSLFCSANNYTQLEEQANIALQNCHKWLLCNRLTLNFEKTHFINFSKDKDKVGKLKLKLDNNEIMQVNQTKYLGLIIQENLKWDSHIQSIINKLNKQIPIYNQLKDILPLNKLTLIYRAISFSIINYGIELYGKNSSSWLKQLQKTQNRLLKIMFKKPRLFGTNKIHKMGNILKIEDLFKTRIMLIAHKFIHFNNQINVAYHGMSLNDNCQRNLRNRLNLKITAEHYQTKNKVIENAATLWNDLDNDIKSLTNRNNFKNKIITNFISYYV